MTAAKHVKEDTCAMMWVSHAKDMHVCVCFMSGGVSYKQDVLEQSHVKP